MPQRSRSICPPRADITIRNLLTRHELFMKTWKESAAYQELSTFFNQTLLKQETLRINSCMCLCLGSFSADTKYPGRKSYKDSLSELVAFESWVELLKTRHKIENIYLQDPVFNALDIELLELKGFSVIETPSSDDLISLSTFLFIPYGGIWGKISVNFSADPVYPPLYIGNDLRRHFVYHEYCYSDKHGEEIVAMRVPAVAPEERDAIFPFIQQSVIMPMPQSDLADWLVGLTLYYKPDSSQDVKPVAFEKNDNDLFTQEEADAQWAGYNG